MCFSGKLATDVFQWKTSHWCGSKKNWYSLAIPPSLPGGEGWGEEGLKNLKPGGKGPA